MPSIRAAFVQAKNKVSLDDVPAPTPGPGEAVVTIEGCGVCGSDFLNAQAWAISKQRFGHEMSARVAAVGQGVSNVAVGDQVAVALSQPCGECEACQANTPRRCRSMRTAEQGGFAEQVLIQHPQLLFKIDPELPPSLAAFVEPLCVVLDGLHLARVGEDPEGEDAFAVVGGGFLAQLALLTAKAKGIPVAGALSRSLSAPLARVLEATGGEHFGWILKGRRTKSVPGLFIQRGNESTARWVVFHTAPASIIPLYLETLPFNSVVLHAGLAAKRKDNEVCLDTQTMIFRRLQLMQPFPVPMLHMEEAIRLLQDHRDLFGNIELEERPLEELPGILTGKEKPRAKVLIKP